jgi:hypothetical protein
MDSLFCSRSGEDGTDSDRGQDPIFCPVHTSVRLPVSIVVTAQMQYSMQSIQEQFVLQGVTEPRGLSSRFGYTDNDFPTDASTGRGIVIKLKRQNVSRSGNIHETQV